MQSDLRKNPALLKLDLYCKGIRIDDSCLIEEHGGRKILRTRAGLGSGLEVVLPAGLWTNVPVVEAEQVVESLKKRNIPVEYVLFPDEGHGWRKTANKVTSTVAIVEWFDRYLK